MSGATRLAQRAINTGLRPLNMQLIRARSDDPAVQTFLQARTTLAAARKAGLSVGDYVDRTFSEPGTTGGTVQAMIEIGQLTEQDVDRVCEIGAGTGRYVEKLMAALHPQHYEVYETADDWVRYLRTVPGVTVRDSDARTLPGTASASVDLVHAQKVFVYTPFWTSVSYLSEMARVVRPGGVLAFDIVTEACMDDTTMASWVRDGSIFRPMPKKWVGDFLAEREMEYVGSHFNSMPPGTSELLVFRRKG